VPGRWAGPLAQGACNALVWLTLWMTLVGYLIIIQDCLVPLAPAGSLLSRRWVWAVIASCVVLPLSLTDLKFLSWTSAFSVCVNLYLFAELCAELYQHGISPDRPCLISRLDPPPRGVSAFLSLISLSIIIQMCVLPMYRDLKGRSPRRFRTALGVSFASLCAIYSAFATVAYLRFGPRVSDNILNDLPQSARGNLARVGMSLVARGEPLSPEPRQRGAVPSCGL